MVNCVVGIFTLVATGPATIWLDSAAFSQRSVAGFRFLAGILEVKKSGGLRQTDDGQTKIIENHRSNQTVVKNFVSKGIQLALLFLQLGTACEQDILIIAVPKSKFLISKKKKFVIAPGRKKFQHIHVKAITSNPQSASQKTITSRGAIFMYPNSIASVASFSTR